jgi:hypothetical protein
MSYCSHGGEEEERAGTFWYFYKLDYSTMAHMDKNYKPMAYTG